ncbi:hypothetical protein BKA64DRAFT_751236 [Cadophora sp. MPI-SDFR-AT-0126]|nr:hypothetical protein BKA64DRAFT_751236 [Leotiomycetes sp. MPI-SDFR-AT-0126]
MGIMGQEISKDEDHDSTRFSPSPPASPTLLVTSRPTETEPVLERAQAFEHYITNKQNKKMKQHIASKISDHIKVESPFVRSRKSLTVIDLVSDDEDPGLPVKDEALDHNTPVRARSLCDSGQALRNLCHNLPKESVEVERKSTTKIEPMSAPIEPLIPRYQSLFKAEKSPEILPFSQTLSSIETTPDIISPGFFTDTSLRFDPISAFHSRGLSALGSPSTEISQFFSPPPPPPVSCTYSGIQYLQNKQPPQQRKLKSISTGWRQSFIARQQSPPRRAARRKQLKAKKPLTVPKLSRGKVFKLRDVYQDYGMISAKSMSSNSSSQGSYTGVLSEERNVHDDFLPPFSSSALDGTFTGQQNQPQFRASRPSAKMNEKPTLLKPHSEMINIALGQTTFAIYADFLRWHCPLLVEECQHACARDRDLPVVLKPLEGVGLDVFGLFINWLHMERVINKRGDPPFQQRTMGLWVLAKRLQMPRLANDAVNALEARRRKEDEIQTKAFHFVYDSTEDGDPLRRYIADVCLLFPPQISEEHKKERFPDELVQDIIVASFADQIKPEDGGIDTARYHMVEL